MFAVSDRFLKAVATGGDVATDLAVLENGTRIDTPKLYVRGGNVTTDPNDSNPGRCSLTLIDPSGALVPSAALDLLSPLASRQVTPYRGMAYSDAPDELVPLGVFTITSCDAEVTNQGTTITLQGTDCSLAIHDNAYVESTAGVPPGYIAAGVDVAQAIHDIAVERGPVGLVVQYTPCGFPTVRTIPDVNGDPWALMQKLATSIGYRLRTDNFGVLHIEPIPDPNAPGAIVRWHYVDNRSLGDPVVRKLTVGSTRDNVYSGAVAIGSNSFGLTPPRALVWDDDPASPTYYLGKFGKKPHVMTPDEKLVNRPQCVAAATGDLNLNKGLPQSLSIDQFVNPALQPTDVIRVDFERIGMAALYSIDRTEIPMGLGDSMPVKARERRIA